MAALLLDRDFDDGLLLVARDDGARVGRLLRVVLRATSLCAHRIGVCGEVEVEFEGEFEGEVVGMITQGNVRRGVVRRARLGEISKVFVRRGRPREAKRREQGASRGGGARLQMRLGNAGAPWEGAR